MKLIKDWKNSWKYQSTQIAIWGQVAQTQWYQYPEFQAYLPQDLVQKISPILAGIVILARIIEFKKAKESFEDLPKTKEEAIQNLLKAQDAVNKSNEK